MLLVFLSGCSVTNSPVEEPPHILIDGKKIELVSDDVGNQYLKQTVSGSDIYIPFPFETEEAEPESKTFQIKQ